MTDKRMMKVCLVLTLATAAACSGDAARGAEEGAQTDEQAPAVAETEVAAEGQVDVELATLGKEIFEGRGCNACHTFGGGRLVGPDLQGVTERRERAWVLAMILSPDSMVRSDPVARQLFSEYMTPMADQNLTEPEANAVYEFLRTEASN